VDLRDPVTFSRIYDRHAGGVYGAALRVLGDASLAQDVVQDVFVKLWRRPSRFDARRGELGPYLRLMARSRALDLYREGQAAGRARERLQRAVPAAEAEGPLAAVERERVRAAVRAALRTLPDSQREAVVLAHWGGLTAEEIARRTRIPLGTAKSRVRLGLAKVRAEVEPAVA
jgi:RNA polymerase sigma-70 factor (ECF subfamily)